MIDGYWLSTFILMAMTIGVLYFRYGSQTFDSNWPLVYYALAVLHLQWFPDGLSQQLVFATILAAMFIRFEFLSGIFAKIVQFWEYAGLTLIAYQLFVILFR